MRINKEGKAVSITKRDINIHKYEPTHFKIESTDRTCDTFVGGKTVEGFTSDYSNLFYDIYKKIVDLNTSKNIKYFQNCLNKNITPFLKKIQNESNNAPYHYTDEIEVCNYIEDLILSLDKIDNIIKRRVNEIKDFVTTISKKLNTVIKSNNKFYVYYRINNFSTLYEDISDTINKIKSHNKKVDKCNKQIQILNLFTLKNNNFKHKINLNEIFEINYSVFEIFKKYFNIFNNSSISIKDYINLLQIIPNYTNYNIDIIDNLISNKKKFIKKKYLAKNRKKFNYHSKVKKNNFQSKKTDNY
jgi:hypothetical protein